MKVVFTLFDHVTQLDFAGPAQILSALPGAELIVAAKDAAPVATDCGFAIMPTTSFAGSDQADVICLPGGPGVAAAMAEPETLSFISGQAQGARYVTSVCTGALLLGGAGLLKGKKATTHWAYTDLLAEFGATHTPGRVVRDGHLITGGGVTAGIDFALTLAAELAGETVAKRLQLAYEYDPAPPYNVGHPLKADADLLALSSRHYEERIERLRSVIQSL